MSHFGIVLNAMSGTQPLRPWREIARELASERNGQRAYELALELSRALDEQECNSQSVKKPQSGDGSVR